MLKPVQFYKNKLILTSDPVIVPEETKKMLVNALRIHYRIDEKFFDVFLAYMDEKIAVFAVRPYSNVELLLPIKIPTKALYMLTKPKIERLLEVIR